MVTLGYAGWAAGQLEHELVQNAWLTVPAELHILFDLPLRGTAGLGTGTAWRQSRQPCRPSRPCLREAAKPRHRARFRLWRKADRRRRWRVATAAGASADHHPRRGNAERFAAIACPDRGMAPASLVVGRPLSLDGTRTRHDRALHALRQSVARPLRTQRRDYAEERLSSVAARSACGPREHELPQRAKAPRRRRRPADPAGLILTVLPSKAPDHLSPAPEHPDDRETMPAIDLPDAEAQCAELAELIRPRLQPDTVLVGIHSGGVWVARRLRELLGLATKSA
jgi:hypothetical protein